MPLDVLAAVADTYRCGELHLSELFVVDAERVELANDVVVFVIKGCACYDVDVVEIDSLHNLGTVVSVSHF